MDAEAAIAGMRAGTTWLLLLAVCMAAGVYLWMGGGDGMEAGRRQEVSRLFAIQPDRIQELILDRDGLRIECRKEEGVWRIVVPVNARADAAEMDRLLTVLSELRRGEVITAAERRDAQLSLAEYGLDRPQARLEWSDGLIRRELRIGRLSPLGNTMYVQIAGSDEIYAVPQTLLHIWPDSVVSLRDRILFHGDPRRAYRAEVRRDGGVLQLQRGDDGVWKLQRPVTAKADPVAVRQWIDRLFDLRVIEFMADVIADPSVYGLGEGATQVTVWTEGQPAGQTLWLGLPIDAEGEWIFARRQDSLSVFAIPAKAQEASRVRSSDVRSRTLVSYASSAIDRIQLEQSGGGIELERINDQWRVRSPQEWPADSERVRELVATWTGARIARFFDPPVPEELEEAFTENSLRVRFSIREQAGVEDQQRWRDLDLMVSATPLSDGQLLVRRDQENSLYAVEGARMEESIVNPLYFWNRQVIDLQKEDVTRVRQQIQGREVEVESIHASEVRVRFPEDGIVQTNLLREAVETLVTLHADEFLLQQPEDWSVYGLDEPEVVWTVRLAAESGIGRVLRLGSRRPDGRVYARTLGNNTLFLLSAEDADRLSQPIVSPEELDDIMIPDSPEQE